jgi:hypothetical protein
MLTLMTMLVLVLMLALILMLVFVLMLALMMMLVLVLILGSSSRPCRPTDGRETKHSECTWDLSSERRRCLGTS